jgi:hypothetical protein
LNAPDAIAGAVARESETGLAALSADHLASDHFKMPLVLPVPAADVAAIKANNAGAASNEDLLPWLQAEFVPQRLEGGQCR